MEASQAHGLVKLVVDANIVFSSLLRSNSIVGDVFFNSLPPLELYAPELLREEIAEHRSKLAKLCKLPAKTILELELLTLSRVTFMNEGLISSVSWARTRDLMAGLDADDESYVALAIHLGIPLWTGDKKLLLGLRRKQFPLLVSTSENPDQLEKDR
jgi:predicted nucleic acid-binding protein